MSIDQKVLKRLEKIIQSGLKLAKDDRQVHARIEDFQIHTQGYAEPGYDSDKPVVLGNFNKVSRWNQAGTKTESENDLPCRVSELLEKAGAELEWADEWTICGNCGKLVRASPDSYSWKRSYVELDGEIECHECVEKHAVDYLETLEGETSKCSTLDNIDPEEHGYKLAKDGLENGLHEHMADDPKWIGSELSKLGITRFLFVLTDPSQFYITFALYIHESEFEKYSEDKINWTKPGLTPAQECQKYLADASIACKTGEPHGSAVVKHLTPKEFVEGNWKE